MTEPQYSSTGDAANEAARLEVAAARREAENRHDTEHEPPPGSWRAQLQDFEPETATMQWDGAEWEIPAEMPNSFYEAVQASDSRGMVQAVLGFEGMARLRVPREISAELLSELASEIAEAAGRVWGIPNRNRSARRSRGTTRR